MKKGFAYVPVLVIIFVVIATGVVAIFAINSRQKNTNNETVTNTVNNTNNVANTNTLQSDVRMDNINVPINNINSTSSSIPTSGNSSSIATVSNNNLHAFRILHVRIILESIKDHRDQYPKTFSELSTIIKDCAVSNKSASVENLSCAEINEQSANGTLVLEDVFTGRPWQYESSGLTYQLPFTVKFYPEIPALIKEGLVEGINIATEKIDTPQPPWNLDWGKQQGTLSDHAICYCVEHPEVFDSMPANQLSVKLKTVTTEGFVLEFCKKMSDQDKETGRVNLKTDADHDGVILLFENSSSLSDNSSDTDGDGHTDLEEILAGYNPNGPGHIEPLD